MKFTKPAVKSHAVNSPKGNLGYGGAMKSSHQNGMHALPAVSSSPLTRAEGPLAIVLEVLVIRKRLIAVCFLATLFLGWLTILLYPRLYSSEAKLMIRVGRESIAIDPTATTSQTLLLQKTQEEEVNSALEVLSSRRVLEQVVDELGADSILNGSLPSADNKPKSWVADMGNRGKETAAGLFHQLLNTAGLKDDVTDRELAVMKLQNSVSIYAPKKTTVVTILGESNSPKMAQTIVRCVIDKFLAEHLKLAKTEGSLPFFVQQAEENEKQLDALLQRRTTIMKERKIASVDSKRDVITTRLAKIDQELLTARSSVEQAQAEHDDLQRQVSTTKDEIVASKLEQTDKTWSAMRNKMYELEIKEGNLASAYTPNHPKLVQIREQLESAKKILANLKSSRVDQSKSPNPVKTRIQEDLRKTQSRIAGLRSFISEKESQRKTAQKEIGELLEHEIEMAELERNIGVSEQSLGMLRVKEEEARVIEELQSKKISNISVFQEPTFVERPVSPNKKVLAGAFITLGLLAGFGSGFLREIGSTVLRTPDQAESNLDHSVVATIGRRKELAKTKTVALSDTAAHFREACQSILPDVLHSASATSRAAESGKILGVLGVSDNCGASSLASSLAIISSQDLGIRTALIDADLANRSTSLAYELNGAPGISELIANQAEYVDCIQERCMGSLSVFSGSAPFSRTPLRASLQEIQTLYSIFREANDLTIIDLPPANRLDNTLPLVNAADVLLVVIESEQTELSDAKRLIRKLELSHANVAGIVLNKSRRYLPRWMTRFLA